MPYPSTNSQKHLVIDGRMLREQGHGIALYLSDLLNGICESKTLFLTYRITVLTPVGSGPWIHHYIPEQVAKWETATSFLSPQEIWQIPILLKKIQADLYFSPSFSSLLHYPCPHIQTVHDLNHLHYGSLFQKIYYRFLLAPSLHKAKAIVTVSNFSQKEISRWLSVDEKNIFVIPNAIRKPSVIFTPNRSGYFLALSNSKPHKNMAMLFRAYAEYANASQQPPLPLLTNIEPPQTMENVEKISLESTSQLWGYLKNAKALFFPSLYEGFGRPPLEAAMAGTPVVASDIEPHREALACFPSQLSHLISPQKSTLWAEAMRLSAQDKLARPLADEQMDAEQKHSPLKLAESYEKIFLGL